MVKVKLCKDCVAQGINTRRKAPYPGPRCKTHHLERKKEQKAKAHETHILKTYNITAQEYAMIHKVQGGKCAICKRATGRTRKLAVDHDHKTGLVRGLLCKTCNRKVLGHLRDDPQAFERGKQYLLHPPAELVIGHRKVPDSD